MARIKRRIKSVNKHYKFIFLIFLLLFLLASFFYYRYTKLKTGLYFSGGFGKESSVRKISLSPRGTPKETQPSYYVEAWEVDVVSTGVIRDYDIRNSGTKKEIGKAKVIEVLAKAGDGTTKKLNFVLEFYLVDNSVDNLQPRQWSFWKNAAILSGQTSSSQVGYKPSREELNLLFAEGTSWVFSPLLEPDSEFNKDIFDEQYLSYAKMYYGEKISELKNFVESGLVEDYDGGPILLSGLNKALD